MTDDGQWLLVVNAGSDDISLLSVDSDANSLGLMDRKPSAGRHPVSIATKHGFVYVLSAGGAVGAADNISGFRLTGQGHLVRIPGSTAPLNAANTGPAEIHFGLNDDELFITEKNTNRIDAFQLDESGSIRSSQTFSSTGVTPFGFSVSRIADAILVFNAAGGAANVSSLTSYRFDKGILGVLAGPVPTNQSAACWVVATVGQDGSLSPVGTTSGLPPASNGVAAR